MAGLERRPNSLQQSVFGKLWSLIAVCGDGTEQYDAVPSCSGPEMGACLFQLERFIEDNQR